MYEFDAHTRELANLERDVREARLRSPQGGGSAARVISILAALIVAGVLVGIGAA